MKVVHELSRSLFWDTNPDLLEWNKDKQLIIERIMTRGITHEVETMFKRYTLEDLRLALLQSKTLDPKSANWFSMKLDVPLNKIHVLPEYY